MKANFIVHLTQSISSLPCGSLEGVRVMQCDTATKKQPRSRTCDKAGSPWAVLWETAWQIDSAVPFFCFHLFLFVLLRIYAQLAIVTILLLTPTRISGCRRFYVLCGIRYPFTWMFDQRCLPRKLLFCFCRISGVPETVVPFPPGQRDR